MMMSFLSSCEIKKIDVNIKSYIFFSLINPNKKFENF